MGIDFLVRQHRRIDHLFRDLLTDGHRRDSLRARLVGELSTHLCVELFVLYPSIAQALGPARDLELHSQERLLREAREVLFTVEGDRSRGEQFKSRIGSLAELYARHVEVQERDLFPACSRRLGLETLRDIMGDVSVVSFRLSASAGQRGERGDRHHRAVS